MTDPLGAAHFAMGADPFPAPYPPDVDPDDAPNGFSRRIAVCRTPGCKGQDIPNPITVYNNDDGIHRAVCGWCGNPVELRNPEE